MSEVKPLTEEHGRFALSPCLTCGRVVTIGGAGRTQHMKTHQRPTIPDEAAKLRFEKMFTVLPKSVLAVENGYT